MATGSVTQTHEYSNPGQVIIKLQWKAGIATGSISTVGLSSYINKLISGKYCLFAVTDPGDSKKPTTNYDIVFNDAFGCDIFGGELANRASGSIEQAAPRVGNAYMARLVTSSLNFALTNNAATAASGSVRLIFTE